MKAIILGGTSGIGKSIASKLKKVQENNNSWQKRYKHSFFKKV